MKTNRFYRVIFPDEATFYMDGCRRGTRGNEVLKRKAISEIQRDSQKLDAGW